MWEVWEFLANTSHENLIIPFQYDEIFYVATCVRLYVLGLCSGGKKKLMIYAFFQIGGINSRRSGLMFGLAHLSSNIGNTASNQNPSLPQKLPALSPKQKKDMHFVHTLADV